LQTILLTDNAPGPVDDADEVCAVAVSEDFAGSPAVLPLGRVGSGRLAVAVDRDLPALVDRSERPNLKAEIEAFPCVALERPSAQVLFAMSHVPDRDDFRVAGAVQRQDLNGQRLCLAWGDWCERQACRQCCYEWAHRQPP